MTQNSYFIKSGYRPRTSKTPGPGRANDVGDLNQRSDVYSFAGYLARRFGCTHILDIGCSYARKLVKLHPDFEIIGMDYGDTIEYCSQNYAFGHWIEADLEALEQIPLDPSIISRSLVICADVIEHLMNPGSLVTTLRHLLDYSPVAVLTTPERDLVHGVDDLGPPANPFHVREWNLAELESYLKSNDLKIQFSGYTANNDRDREKKVSVILLENNHAPLVASAPSRFRVMAIMCVYNEKDIIIPVINQLNREGVDVYLMDSWSTDGTFELASQMIHRGVAGIERWPESGPSPKFNLGDLLKRKEELCQQLDADWFIHQDADEFRESPWKGVRLRDAIYRVDQQGYNAIDFTLLNFLPVDNNYPPGSPLTHYFKYFEFGVRMHPALFIQIRAWKKTDGSVDLIGSGGHSAEFPGRKIYPYKFLLRHYPIRSQAHAERKIFHERKARVDPVERKKGWNVHYDVYVPGANFLKDPEELIEFRPSFHADYLIERLSGIGTISLESVKNELEIQLEAQINEKEKALVALTAQVNQQEATLQEIYGSRAWRLIRFLRKLRLKLAPPNGALERIWYSIYKSR